MLHTSANQGGRPRPRSRAGAIPNRARRIPSCRRVILRGQSPPPLDRAVPGSGSRAENLPRPRLDPSSPGRRTTRSRGPTTRFGPTDSVDPRDPAINLTAPMGQGNGRTSAVARREVNSMRQIRIDTPKPRRRRPRHGLPSIPATPTCVGRSPSRTAVHGCGRGWVTRKGARGEDARARGRQRRSPPPAHSPRSRPPLIAARLDR